jgi:hypothetical protein
MFRFSFGEIENNLQRLIRGFIQDLKRTGRL